MNGLQKGALAALVIGALALQGCHRHRGDDEETVTQAEPPAAHQDF